MRKNQTLILAVVAALGLFLVLRRGGQPEQAAPSAEFGGAADAQYEGGARGVRSNAEIEVPPPPPPESVNKAARAEGKQTARIQVIFSNIYLVLY